MCSGLMKSCAITFSMLCIRLFSLTAHSQTQTIYLLLFIFIYFAVQTSYPEITDPTKNKGGNCRLCPFCTNTMFVIGLVKFISARDWSLRGAMVLAHSACGPRFCSSPNRVWVSHTRREWIYQNRFGSREHRSHAR